MILKEIKFKGTSILLQYFFSNFTFLCLGLVTTPKSQGTCGSCAAFASTGAFETCMLKAGASKTNLDLSEQWLLNCAYQTTAFPQFK